MPNTLIIEAKRGEAVESRHPVSAVLVNAAGHTLEAVGEPLVTTWRSAAKPFQLEANLAALPPEWVTALAPEDLAVAAASHSAQPGHVARVSALLARFGLGVEHLYCGAHWPMHEGTTQALWRSGHACSALHNNCSGKHGLMAAAARQAGAPPDYRPDAHPVQRAILANVQARTGGRVRGTVTDGCGVPCFVLPLEGMAQAYAQLAQATHAGEGGLGAIGAAMLAHPWWVSGDGRLDLQLAGAARQPLITKVGAAALLCVALPEAGLGLAIKVHSGDDEARAVAVGAVLDRWFPGLLPDGALSAAAEVHNVVGAVVGERVVVWG